jgi:hypothetical protein
MTIYQASQIIMANLFNHKEDPNQLERMKVLGALMEEF